MTPDLDSIRASLASLAAAPGEVPPEYVPGLVAELARAQAALLVAATRAPAPVGRGPERLDEDELLDVDRTAALLGLSPQWLYRHSKQLPFARRISPKILRFSRAGALRWLATKRP